MHSMTWSRVELPCTLQCCRWQLLSPFQGPCVLNRFCVFQIDRLISYGADILKPVMLVQGDRMAVGTAVDYGYFKFYQVWLRFLSRTPLRLGSSWAKLGGCRDLMMANRCSGHLWASGPLCQASVLCVLCVLSHISGDGEVACSLSYSAVWAGGGLKSLVSLECPWLASDPE